MKLAAVFTDHAVLQRNMYVPVWGTTEQPGTLVRAEIAGVKAAVRSSLNGDFLLRLPPLEAGGPCTLRVWAEEEGEEAVLNDIMIGEVWLASGQSNMEYKLGSDWSIEKDLPEEERKCTVNLQQAREFHIRDASRVRGLFVPEIATGCNERSIGTVWKCMTEEEAMNMTAVGMWFAKYLEENLDVPVGIICAAWGGTGVEAWTSRSAFMSDPKARFWMNFHDAVFYREEVWRGGAGTKPAGPSAPAPQDRQEDSRARPDPGNRGFDMGWASPDFDDSAWKEMKVPGSWIKQKLAGNGVFWGRCRVQIPEAWAGHGLSLHLGGIDKTDITYFNGAEIGRTGSGFDTAYWSTLRVYKVPAELVRAGTCVIAVRAFSFKYDGSFNSNSSLYYLKCDDTGEKLPLAGTWKGNAEADFGVVAVNKSDLAMSFGCVEAPGPDRANTPGILFHSMIRPLIPFGLRGVIWYQGEHNEAWSSEYARSLELMIRDWRYQWAQGDFPFIQVQLAGYGAPCTFEEDSAAALLREAQEDVCRDLPEVYLVTAVDIGDPNDIHPQNKKDVGHRLAFSALHHVYRNSSVVPCGPIFEKCSFEGRRLRVSFRYAEGLHFHDGGPRGFYLAGRSGEFHPADEVRIEGETLLLASREVDIPLAVRYSWAKNPDGNLRNGAGLPAFPFRTRGNRF